MTRTSDNSLILSSGPSPIFINVRFPENSVFTKADETDKDDVQNCWSFAYDWMKSQQVPTSFSISASICACSDSGLMDFISNVFS